MSTLTDCLHGVLKAPAILHFRLNRAKRFTLDHE